MAAASISKDELTENKQSIVRGLLWFYITNRCKRKHKREKACVM